MTDTIFLNLGCGNRFHPEWLNIDLVSSTPEVIAHDLSRGIPLASQSCHSVYHSHLIEHLPRQVGRNLLRECFRVLKPGGIIRIATPDLERICRIYLQKLDEVASGHRESIDDLEWITLELLDQMVRETSGGLMKAYLSRKAIPNQEFVLERIGEEGRRIIGELHKTVPQTNTDRRSAIAVLSGLKRLIAHQGRRQVIRLLGRKALRAFDIGSMRLSGEVHYWLYDRITLSEALKDAGFQQPTTCGPLESRIQGWERFHLDTLADGTVIKPDSLFMEALRP